MSGGSSGGTPAWAGAGCKSDGGGAGGWDWGSDAAGAGAWDEKFPVAGAASAVNGDTNIESTTISEQNENHLRRLFIFASWNLSSLKTER